MSTFELYKTKPCMTHEQLRERRAEIAAYLRDGHTLDQAAEKFCVTKRTVRRAAEEHEIKIFSGGACCPPESGGNRESEVVSRRSRARDSLIVVYAVSQPRFTCDTAEVESHFLDERQAEKCFDEHVRFVTHNRSDYRDSHVRMRRIVFRVKESGREALLDMLNRGTFGMIEDLEIVRFWRHPGDHG